MKLGVVMDPIQGILAAHDSTLAMLWEAEAREWLIYYLEPKDLFLRNGRPYGHTRLLKVFKDLKQWYAFEREQTIPLDDLDLILMRKDPPFDQEYLYLTQLLELVEQAGTVVVNKPQALREFNEKLAIAYFPTCCVPTIVASKMSLLKEFWQEEKDIVCKPLHAMGGHAIFRLRPDEANATVIFETLTQQETRHVTAQRYIPEIVQGDKRILLINGQAFPYALARVPQAGDWRGNMAVGAKPVAQPLSKQDHWICEQLGPTLRAKGIYFAGIDVIGDYLTEINITSPTGIRELTEQTKMDPSKPFFDFLQTLK